MLIPSWNGEGAQQWPQCRIVLDLKNPALPFELCWPKQILFVCLFVLPQSECSEINSYRAVVTRITLERDESARECGRLWCVVGKSSAAAPWKGEISCSPWCLMGGQHPGKLDHGTQPGCQHPTVGTLDGCRGSWSDLGRVTAPQRPLLLPVTVGPVPPAASTPEHSD